MNNITREKEASFEMDILTYLDLAIDDNDTDGDRVVGYILACLSAQSKINIARVAQFYKEAREKIS